MIRRARRGMATYGIVALMTTLNALTAGQPAVTDLLKPLNLSGYASSMRPPDLSGLTADGKKVALSALRGTGVLLNFYPNQIQ